MENTDSATGPSHRPHQQNASRRNSDDHNSARRRTSSYRRNYRACDLCRQKKIRCDLGDTHNPQPPCVKCKREKKNCVFGSITTNRAQAKHPRLEGPSNGSPVLSSETCDNTAQNQNRIPLENDRRQSGFPLTEPSLYRRPEFQHDQHFNNTRTPDMGLLSPSSGSTNTRPPIPQSLVDTVVRDDTDALRLLFYTTQHDDSHPGSQSAQDPNLDLLPHGTQPDANHSSHTIPQDFSNLETASLYDQSPDLLIVDGLLRKLPHLNSTQTTLWTYFAPCLQRFVKVEEVVSYLDYFFSHLNKQMPILNDWYSDHANHQALITDDPLLCYTILTISSRYLILPGFNGPSRGYLLHDYFFKYVQDGLQSLLWGVPLGRATGMNSIGVIESLMLLTQWQPRGLHLLTSTFDLSKAISVQFTRPSRQASTRDGHQIRISSAMALRSDAMCWRLANLAVTLASETNIFAEPHELEPESLLCSGDNLRVPHLQRILYIYISHLATRLKRPNPIAHIMVADLKRNVSITTEARPIERPSDWPIVLNAWLDLLELGHVAMDTLYPSPRDTQRLAREGRQETLVRHLALATSRWWADFEHLDLPKPFRCNMEVEYHYLRILIHSVSLQSQPRHSPQHPYTQWQGLGKQRGRDKSLLEEVANSCCKVYSIVIELHQLQALRAVTTPLLLRLVTVLMFGLKLLATGHAENDNLQEMLDGAICALRESAIDDLHLSGYFAQLLERLAQKAKLRSSQDQASLHNQRSLVDRAGQTGPDQSDINLQEGGPETCLTEEDTIDASDWDNWLAFQFDPTLATIADFENHDDVSRQHTLASFHGQGM